ncbi:hypothetical protein GCM10010401_04110 [Rarobacter faecitabidus]|uniref:LPXTG-motif cell wall-anchored protein/uncharacterized repeat protein (TIGR01451 family) n=1 Tax=Rarobacter faecitabidus TaxID=13243 RepID=A0A542ZTZ8_RARFA|nr:SpaA isopeptide-forming pilin-related protein [Rarobacter faecitabidus]TQL63833.1 LPXTG-motif cell wall-anchored protein/uncharacterized repeat protein (TIGR01451 family) [Rarobacter faecitabidus]
MGTTPGWLQLTDTGSNRTGGILYNQALPATGGLIVTFDQAQYGGNGADGISFFLSDGAYQLTDTGAPGGSLGYASRDNEPGVEHGFLGLGLDAWGNYPRNNENRGRGCTSPQNPGFSAGNQDNYRPNVSLRGPGRVATSGALAGQWVEGYCLWASTSVNGQTANQNWWDHRSWGIRDTGSNPVTAVRRVKITITPANSNGFTTITVEIDPDGSGPQGFVTMLTYTTDVEIPATYKFGFSSSTGGSNDVHLIRNLAVETYDNIDGLGLVKALNTASPLYRTTYRQGDLVPYNFTLTNGGVALSNVQVHDPKITSISCPSTTLAAAGQPGSTMTCTGTYTVTAADAATATAPDYELSNTANATGVFSSTTVTSNNSTAIAKLEAPDPKIRLTKTAVFTDGNANGEPNIGETISYSFSVENTGNITLAPVTLADPLLGWTAQACVASLAPGATATCSSTGSHSIVVGDLAAGHVQNTATARGVSPHNPSLTVTDDDSANVLTPARPELTVTKAYSISGADSLADEGETVTFTFSVTNTGNVPLTNVTITDPLAGLTLSLTNAPCVSSLAVGATASCAATATYTVTRADLRRPGIPNTAYANATSPGSIPNPTQAQHSVTVPAGPARAGITLIKIVDNGTTGSTATPADFTIGAEPHSDLIAAGQPIISGTGNPGQTGGVSNVPVRPGNYYLKDYETTDLRSYPGPPGYTPGAWSCVDQNDDPVLVDTGHWDRIYLTGTMDVTCSVTNTAIAGTATWDKVNTDTSPQLLSGSVWTLTGPSYPGGVQIADCDATLPAVCSGLDGNATGGRFSLSGLAWGTYTLVEYAAPLGHLIDTTPHTFTVTGSTNTSCVATGHTCIALGQFANARTDALTLPLTGGFGADWLLAGGALLVALALAMSIVRRRRGSRGTPQTGMTS